MKDDTIKQRLQKSRLLAILISVIIAAGIISYYVTRSWIKSIVTVIILLALLKFGQYARRKLRESARLKKWKMPSLIFLSLCQAISVQE